MANGLCQCLVRVEGRVERRWYTAGPPSPSPSPVRINRVRHYKQAGHPYNPHFDNSTYPTDGYEWATMSKRASALPRWTIRPAIDLESSSFSDATDTVAYLRVAPIGASARGYEYSREKCDIKIYARQAGFMRSPLISTSNPDVHPSRGKRTIVLPDQRRRS